MRFLRRRYKDPLNQQDFKLLHYGEVQMFPGGGGLLGASPIGAPGVSGGTSQLLNAAAAQGMTGAMAQGLALQSGNNSAGSSSQDASGQTNVQGGAGAEPTPATTQVFGGGPIVGVASKSKDKTIREFNKKNHYNDWQFIYDPNTDRGGLLNTPAQPPLQGAAQNLNGQQTQTGPGNGFAIPGAPFGSSAQTPQQNSNQGQQLVQPQPPDQ
jgi:hypothetical protein